MIFTKKFTVFCYQILFLILVSSSFLFSQRRGEDQLFQGLNELNINSAGIAAMGGASLALSGDVNYLNYNPAGLASISDIKISYTANNYETKLWENQDYRPNRQFTNLSFILDGLYIPNPENNGKYDYDAFFDDSTYIVSDPELGLDPFSEDASNWKKSKSDFVFNNFNIAVPLTLFETPIVLSAGYSKKNNIFDYDRNTTYLDPHIGYNGYGDIEERVTSAEDTVTVNWFDYKRMKTGEIMKITAGVSASVLDFLDFGFSVNILNGESDDYYALNKIGYFDLLESANSFKFSYDYNYMSKEGKSDYSATNFTFGAVINLNRIKLGLTLKTPYTLTRDWEYTQIENHFDSVSTQNFSGTDEVEYPFGYAVGLSFNPIDDLTLAVDFEKNNYSNAKFKITSVDSSDYKWSDQIIIRVGSQYKLTDYIHLMLGYRSDTQDFIPDGAAIKDYGPINKSYSAGISLLFEPIQLDIAYEYSRLRYYDSYFSNTNYNTKRKSNLLMSFTINL